MYGVPLIETSFKLLYIDASSLLECYVEAVQCFENFYSLTNGRLWQMENSDRSLFSIACESLQNVYTTLAMQVFTFSHISCVKSIFTEYKVAVVLAFYNIKVLYYLNGHAQHCKDC